LKIQNLSIAERIKLVEDIWDSIAEEQESIQLSEEQKQLLKERLNNYEISGEPGRPAFEAIEEIRNQL
jgi:putative addiction module component (TIGR02574 family)